MGHDSCRSHQKWHRGCVTCKRRHVNYDESPPCGCREQRPNTPVSVFVSKRHLQLQIKPGLSSPMTERRGNTPLCQAIVAGWTSNPCVDSRRRHTGAAVPRGPTTIESDSKRPHSWPPA
ncbi:uncharacterized protein BO80DRAFT_32123 [Aspergillus ibericus CBS 121593]|uniref:Uncharacterized protein n=1 Tax=Aspergillus ibericus CBS 121593 TaxID=1448316 RepID=A0A395H354_9EURO|nr:hypothetical protein BO80DRAFT_32123 [Aspergillus ibericus CBS 121593]RAL02311.1 hypothetical protein BO80DRAFT_32123 [Aspergillus ibericus CBS 121593]